MSGQAIASQSIPEAEYSVYVYLFPEDIGSGHTDWEMRQVTGNINDAVTEAQKLFNTRNFKKVEVKKKYFDTRYSRVVDATCKVFQERKRASRRFSVMFLLGLSCLVCMGLLAIPLFGII